MTTRQWILVAAALGIGIVAQIPLDHAMEKSEPGAAHEMGSRDHVTDMAVAAGAGDAAVDTPNGRGLAHVTFAITGMT